MEPSRAARMKPNRAANMEPGDHFWASTRKPKLFSMTEGWLNDSCDSRDTRDSWVTRVTRVNIHIPGSQLLTDFQSFFKNPFLLGFICILNIAMDLDVLDVYHISWHFSVTQMSAGCLYCSIESLWRDSWGITNVPRDGRYHNVFGMRGEITQWIHT